MMSKLKEDFVEWVGENFKGQQTIKIICEDKKKKEELKKIGAKSSIFNKKLMNLRFSSEEELIYFFSKIRDIGICFAGELSGWSPAAIFEDLRDKGMLDGKYTEITWKGPSEYIKLEK